MRNMLELSCNRSLLMFESIKVFNERRKALPARTQVTLVVDFLNWLDQGCTPRQTIQLMHSMALELRDKDLSRALENVQSRLSEGKTLADALRPWVSEELYLMLASGAPIPTILSSIERYQQMLIQQQRSEEHTSELQSRPHLVCRLLLEKKKKYERSCLGLAIASALNLLTKIFLIIVFLLPLIFIFLTLISTLTLLHMPHLLTICCYV